MGRLFGKFVGVGFLTEVPSGTIDGTNVAFTLTNPPVSAGAVLVHLDGVLLNLTDDYTLSGSTITFTSAPIVGQNVLVHYLKQK